VIRRLCVSFSGGETSAYMLLWIIQNWKERYDEIVTVFANTGCEHEETLIFVDKVAQMAGADVVWVEYRAVNDKPSFAVVGAATASRDGEPFAAMCARYGIPNRSFPHCTRSLKERPITAYLRSIGWPPGSYHTAIGIRSDEKDRMSATARARGLVYPLATEHPVTKPQINTFWSRQTFRLGIPGYMGNCTWCWKKSLRKHGTLALRNPEVFSVPRRLEQKYELVGPEFLKENAPGYRRRLFRENRSVADLFMFAHFEDFAAAPDENAVLVEWDPDLDVAGACGESCEVFTDDAED
jgi:hypothetical protein